MTDATPSRALTWPAVRKLVLQAIIAAVLAAAAIAIFAIIAGSFGALEQKLLAVVLVFLGFAFFALFDAAVLSRRNDGLALISVAVALFLLVVGVLKVALAASGEFATHGIWSEFGDWVGLAFVDRVALLWVWLLAESHRVARRPMLRALAVATTALVVVVAVLLSIPLLAERGDFPDAYWRATAVAVVLALLGTALLPLLAWVFRSRTPVVTPAPGSRRLAWPRYEDGTPLPAGADGRPDYSQVLQEQPTPPGTAGAAGATAER